MDESKAIEYLMHFGMSRQEATVYLRLIEAGKIQESQGRMCMHHWQLWLRKGLHIW